jgi:hypothetical protein
VPRPSWNIGAGVFASGSQLFGASGESVPTYAAALERRLGSRTWLALNARFSYTGRDLIPPSSNTDPSPAPLRVNTSNGAALLGLRHVFAQGLVDVSGHAALFGRFQRVAGDQLRAIGAIGQAGLGDGNSFGVLVGMAAERELIEALGLRLSLDVGTFNVWSEDSTRLVDGVEQHTTLGSTRVALALAPALQLHFYF